MTIYTELYEPNCEVIYEATGNSKFLIALRARMEALVVMMNKVRFNGQTCLTQMFTITGENSCPLKRSHRWLFKYSFLISRIIPGGKPQANSVVHKNL